MTADIDLSPGVSGLAARAGAPVDCASLAGRWERSLLRAADGRVDTTTEVVRLQAPSLFVDLRLPAGRPPEGFAGALAQTGRIFEWWHEVDLGSSAAPDAGTLHWEGGRLVKREIHGGQVEHWRRTLALDTPCWGLRLADRRGQQAVLVRVGDDIGWACGPRPAEISLARVRGDLTVITRSSSRVRAGARLFWSVTATTATVAVAGLDGVTRSRWRISHREHAA